MPRAESRVSLPCSREQGGQGRVSSTELERRWNEGLVIFHSLTSSEARRLTNLGAVRDRRRRCWLVPSGEVAEKIGFHRVKLTGRGIYARKPKVVPCPDCARHFESGHWRAFDGDGDRDSCLRCGALIRAVW